MFQEGPFAEFRVFAFEVVDHPGFGSGEDWVFAGLEFEFDEGLGEKVGGEDGFAFEFEAAGVSLEEDVINLV